MGQSAPWIAADSPESLEPVPSTGPEFWNVLYVDTCGWPTIGEYGVSIQYPEGSVEFDTNFKINTLDECTRYLKYLLPQASLGTYIIQFATYENMKQVVNLVPPSGPRLYVFHEGNQGSTSLLLHLFAPHETVRLYEYKPDEVAPGTLVLVGWQEFQTDANGQLYIGTPDCICLLYTSRCV